MPTSGTTTFVPITDDTIVEAWERCGLSPTLLNADASRSARRSLQLMMLDWANQSVPLWRVERKYAQTAPGQADYPCPPGTVDVLEVGIQDGRMLTSIGRDEWFRLPQQERRGRPTQFWAERGRDQVILHLWPVPDAAYQLAINRFRQPQDIGSLGQSADVPIQWAEALTAGLAARLAVKFAPDRVGMLTPLGQAAFQNALEEDRERVPLTVLPEMGWLP